MIPDLPEWLRTQLDTDERIAREAAMAVGRTGYEGGVLVEPPARFGDDLVADGAQWVSSHHLVVRKRLGPEEKGRTVADCGGFGARPVAVHAAAHDPARVLREIDAKRATLAQYTAAVDRMDQAMRDGDTAAYQAARVEAQALQQVVRRDAAVYAGRPGYRPEWRP
ncbi:DUF6221 family protein [Streptomyces sp. PD-S100-1]|uniref:DUF6221 family protein n=1 Tax=Streptomyces sp. PD-S100-1 TaxID=3394351 RepID=UPI0039BC7D7B